MNEAWPEVTLGELCRLIVDRENAAAAAGVPYVGLEHMPSGFPRIHDRGTTDGLASQVIRFRAEDTLFGRLRPYLKKVALANFSGVCSPEILVLRPLTARVEPAYLYLLAASEPVVEWAVASSAGSRMPRTAASDLLAHRLRLPPIAEQRRIVDLIGAVDEVRAHALLQEQVSERFLAALRRVQIAESGAPRRRLGEVLEDIDGGVSPLTEGRAPLPGEPAVLKLSAVRPGRFRPDEAKALPDGVEMPMRALVRVGDVLITRSNTPDTVGYVCLVDRVKPLTYLSDLILRLHPGRELLAGYLAQAMLTDDARFQIAGSARGTSGSMRKISRGTIRQIEIPVPVSLDTQRSVAGLITAAAAVRDQAHEIVGRAAVLRSTLFGDLLSGEHRLPGSYDRFLDGAA